MTLPPFQLRVARPTADLAAAVAFYRDLVGLPLLSSFADHDGFSGAILGEPERQLELVAHDGVVPSPTSEDQLVLYLGSADAVTRAAERIEAGGHARRVPANPYWVADGAAAFTDPDGYWLILSPSRY